MQSADVASFEREARDTIRALAASEGIAELAAEEKTRAKAGPKSSSNFELGNLQVVGKMNGPGARREVDIQYQ
jgi:hypothetical protein